MEALLGYLNFSEGRPDPRFQQRLNEAYGRVAERDDKQPWLALARVLHEQLAQLIRQGLAAFRDTRQAQAVLSLTFDGLLPAYRVHHRDLFHHLDDRELFGPFFLA